MNRLTSKKRIIELVEAFTKENPKDINEAETRLRFINPFFELLGWNILDPKEVKIETATAKQTSTRPDYRFLINRNTKFFVEAKKPAVKLTDPNPIFQAKSYGFSAKVPLVILTDFEEFRPFKSIARPKLNRPLEGLIKEYDFNYIQYVDEFDKLYDTFSREAVSAGELEKKFTTTKTENLTTVDKEFLNDLSNWQEDLAKNISLRNPKLKVPEINEAVQRILDRIIFIRICEDREIEDKEILFNYIFGDDIYRNLLKEFRRMRAKYNGLLFNEHQLSENLSIDDKILKSIIKTLYPPNSPYRFDEIPIEILGTIYEQFLGKVITLTPAHRAKVEVKPEVRKAGGVFYTPQYIVKYIVKNTVGKLIENEKPSEIAKLRFADIACGSGSFLLEMFQVLIDHHIDYYSTNQEEIKKVDGIPDVYKDETGLWHLSTRKKKEILLNNIYGVDIDPQAVEVSTMSLYLKLLEGENAETFSKQLKLEMKETILPNLSNNIKCGNSLIGTDILDMNKDLFGSEIDLLKIRPFDWETAFPNIMRPSTSSGQGFDAIVGNPPYIRIQTMKEWTPIQVEYFKDHYTSASKGNYDIYVICVERALSLLNKNGKLGYILPHKFFNSQYGEPLRKVIAGGRHLAHVVHFGAQQVFEGATTYTCLLFLDKAGANEFQFTKVDDIEDWLKVGKAVEGVLSASTLDSHNFNFSVGEGRPLFERLKKMPLTLGDIADIFVGVQTSADDVFIMDIVEKAPRSLRLKSKSLKKEWTFEKDLFYPIVSGTDVNRYSELPSRQYVLFPYKVKNEVADLLDFKEIQDIYPKTASYLLENKQRLEQRERGKFKGRDWYRFGRSQNLGIQGRTKLCIPRLVNRLYAAFDYDGSHCLDNVDVGGITLKIHYNEMGYRYLLGLLNSSLLCWYFPFVSAPFRGGWLSANRQFLSLLPIRTIDFSNPEEKIVHDRMVELVDRMLELHKMKQQAKSDSEKELFDHQIKATDKEIDELVYRLYEINEDERKLL